MRGVAERAARTFRAEHGRNPDSVWSAPGRVNLIGEHTDYNDGYVLPFALPFRTAVAVRERTDGHLSCLTVGADQTPQQGATFALDTLETTSVRGWQAYPVGVAWALRAAGIDLPGADLVIAGDIPTGAGLSSSAALECATALALLATGDRSPDGAAAPSPAQIARWAQHAENDFVGVPSGILDQMASLTCIEAHALFLDVRTGETEQIPFEAAEAGLETVIIDTRVAHSHSESGYSDRRRGCERAAKLLDVSALRDITRDELDDAQARLPSELRGLVRHVVSENERVSAAANELRAGNFADLGSLLTRSHESLRDDYTVSCPELDLAVEVSLAQGALGARMTGGGFGGSAIALINTEARPALQDAITTAFRQRGFPKPRVLSAVPSAGAGKEAE